MSESQGERFKNRLGLQIQFLRQLFENTGIIGIEKNRKIEEKMKRDFKLIVKESSKHITGNFQDLFNTSKDSFNTKNKALALGIQAAYEGMGPQHKKDFQEGLERVNNFMDELLSSITTKIKYRNSDGTTRESLNDKGPFTWSGRETDSKCFNEIFQWFGEGIDHALSTDKIALESWPTYKKDTIQNIQKKSRELSKFLIEHFKYRLGLHIQFIQELREKRGIEKEKKFDPALRLQSKKGVMEKSLLSTTVFSDSTQN
ncbi:hypothetical protein [Holospora curviuscula]|uniref:Uncharacterized protein n=1 Tax=Holospora curviuscula TaxID=1082868 RepID=A0A2S5RE31_9PROT|nr:hypothetical protein [Holospora curviuscula]PPE05573.1 hypothetical protein HCUR_00219 [Holospora curviuscula]